MRGLLRGARTRILAAFVILLAFSTLLSVLAIRQLLLVRTGDRVDAALNQEVDEFRQLVRGNDPETGEAFRGRLNRIFDVYFQRNVPGGGETLIAFWRGRYYFDESAATGGAIPEDAWPARWATLAEPERGDIETAVGTVRYLAVPVRFGNEVRGVFVVAASLGSEREEVEEAVRLAALVLISVLLIASALAWVVAGRILSPLRLLADTARSIGESDLTRRIPVSGKDEIAELGMTFNAMLDRLEAAFATQRAFVSDASHELRTPITIVRGHLELLGDDPQERRETITLVTDELDRMSRFVDDLLVLAKSERDDFLKVRAGARRADRRAVRQGGRARPPRLAVGGPRRGAAGGGPSATDAGRHGPGPECRATHGGRRPDLDRHRGRLSRGAPVGARHRARDRARGPGTDLRALRASERQPPAVGGCRARPGHRPRDRRVARRACGTLEPAGSRRHVHLDHPVGGHMSRILIAEDEPRLSSFLEKGLRAAGYNTTVIDDGVRAATMARDAEFDLLILDIGLPGQDGFAVLRTIRGRGEKLPVLILTARDEVVDTVTGLDSGADDYVTKPFVFEELLARVRARLRAPEQDDSALELTGGGVRLDVLTRRAEVDGDEVELTAKEFTLLETFLRHPGQVLSREQLLSHVWGYDFDPGSNVVDVYVGYLRRKLGSERFETVRGMGYRLKP